MNGEHAPLPPSSAEQWANCSGSRKMQEMFPERPDSPSALEGEAAHWVLSECIAGRIYPVGTLAPNGVAITDEMHEGAESFVENIPVDVMGAGGCSHVEERVECSVIHEDCWGTPDVWWVRDNVLHVADYKFGHRYVDAWHNWQLICYAAGILAMHDFGNISVRLSICQPRCYSGEGVWRTWETTAETLQPLIVTLRNSALLAMSYEDVACTSGHHCAHCTAIVHCPAAQHAVSDAIGVSYMADPSTMSPKAMGLMRTLIAHAQDILKSMSDGLDEEIAASIRAGNSVPGWTFAPGRGKVAWNVPYENIVSLGQVFGVEFAKQATITPTQAIALLKKAGIDGSVVEASSTTIPGALKLVESKDGDFAKIFS